MTPSELLKLHPDTLLDDKQASPVIGDPSLKTMARWRSIGYGPVFTKIGARVRYRVADLQAFIQSQGRTSTSDPGPDNDGRPLRAVQ